MSDHDEKTVAALNTLIGLALQDSNTQQAQVQNAANILAGALGIGLAGEEESVEPTIVTTD